MVLLEKVVSEAIVPTCAKITVFVMSMFLFGSNILLDGQKKRHFLKA